MDEIHTLLSSTGWWFTVCIGSLIGTAIWVATSKLALKAVAVESERRRAARERKKMRYDAMLANPALLTMEMIYLVMWLIIIVAAILGGLICMLYLPPVIHLPIPAPRGPWSQGAAFLISVGVGWLIGMWLGKKSQPVGAAFREYAKRQIEAAPPRDESSI